jgi:hypothetical protein
MALSSCRSGGAKTLSDGSYWWTFTATILTMVVLPVLFGVLMERIKKTFVKRSK